LECPTLVVLQRWVPPDEANEWLQRDEFRYLSPAELDLHRTGGDYLKGFTVESSQAAAAGDAARKRLTKALHDCGARILLGTDYPNALIAPDFSMHGELHNLVEAGLTPDQAIKAGTRDAAEFFHALHELGTVAVGWRAALNLLEADPLHDTGNVARRVGVMVRGRWYPQAELQAG